MEVIYLDDPVPDRPMTPEEIKRAIEWLAEHFKQCDPKLEQGKVYFNMGRYRERERDES